MASSIDTRKGTVAWYDVRRGFGFITPEDGGENLFVHNSSIKAVGYRSLIVGDAVEFVVSVGDDGRKRAVSVTGPGGAYIKGRRYFNGACYRCGEIGHMAMDCGRIGPCYSCGVMGHLARDCAATRAEPSSPSPNLLIPSNLGSISPHSSPMVLPLDLLKDGIRTLSDQFSECSYPEEEEEDDDDEINDEDKEFPRGAEERNWAELPCDVLWVIFKKIAALEIIRSAQFVCRMWRHLSHEPDLWRCIEIKVRDGGLGSNVVKSMAMIAIDRSKGCVEEFYLECFGSEGEELLSYISDRATKMRRLHLISIYSMSEMELAQSVRKFSLLEDFEISFCFFSAEVVELVGLACPQLKSFSLNGEPYKHHYNYYGGDSNANFDAKAFAIATHMQQLHRLQLIGDSLTNIGLLAILNSCPNLQYLDIRACFNVNVDESLKQKCSLIKDLRLPQDSTADYEFNALIVGRDPFDSDFEPTQSDSEYDFYFDDSICYHYDGYSDNSYDDLFEFS
ncbi:hypothetical protein M5K25_012383 [Dendrobium thyrsiflorum]|uniref:Uncharacterized protein n=1 Tax=Dendrobium thyrsiflorum TaxID=117978 RepID=A0ABD0UX84_DENTH